MKSKTMEKKSLEKQLLEDILPHAKDLKVLRERAEEFGMFLNDRELLRCRHCKIMEDVTYEGLLIVCSEEDIDEEHQPKDLNVRFTQISDDEFICPLCSKVAEFE